METFDPKPDLNRYAGMTFDKTPFENPVHSPLHQKRFRSVPSEEINIRDVYPTIYPMQVGWQKCGQSGIEVTDWWPHLSKCVDDISFIRNMWTTDNDHAAEINFIPDGTNWMNASQASAPGLTMALERSTRTYQVCRYRRANSIGYPRVDRFRITSGSTCRYPLGDRSQESASVCQSTRQSDAGTTAT